MLAILPISFVNCKPNFFLKKGYRIMESSDKYHLMIVGDIHGHYTEYLEAMGWQTIHSN